MRKKVITTEIYEYAVEIYCPTTQYYDDEWFYKFVYFREPYTTEERAEWLYQEAIKMHQEKHKQDKNCLEPYPKKRIEWIVVERDITEEKID